MSRFTGVVAGVWASILIGCGIVYGLGRLDDRSWAKYMRTHKPDLEPDGGYSIVEDDYGRSYRVNWSGITKEHPMTWEQQCSIWTVVTPLGRLEPSTWTVVPPQTGYVSDRAL